MGAAGSQRRSIYLRENLTKTDCRERDRGGKRLDRKRKGSRCIRTFHRWARDISERRQPNKGKRPGETSENLTGEKKTPGPAEGISSGNLLVRAGKLHFSYKPLRGAPDSKLTIPETRAEEGTSGREEGGISQAKKNHASRIGETPPSYTRKNRRNAVRAEFQQSGGEKGRFAYQGGKGKVLRCGTHRKWKRSEHTSPTELGAGEQTKKTHPTPQPKKRTHDQTVATVTAFVGVQRGRRGSMGLKLRTSHHTRSRPTVSTGKKSGCGGHTRTKGLEGRKKRGRRTGIRTSTALRPGGGSLCTRADGTRQQPHAQEKMCEKNHE